VFLSGFWNGNCIGRRNYPVFIAFLALQTLDSVLLTALYYLSDEPEDKKTIHSFAFFIYVIAALFAVTLIGLLLLYLKNLITNVTMFESLSPWTIDYLLPSYKFYLPNPFDKGWRQNIVDTLIAPQDYSDRFLL